MKLWDKFSSSFPQLERPVTERQSVPTISTLQQEVLKAEKEWSSNQEAGWGRAKSRFFTFMDTMKDHSYLFSFIPDGDKYISLFTGVISSVVKVELFFFPSRRGHSRMVLDITVKVSVNYKKVAEGFNIALSEISEDLRFIRRSSRISDSP